jgi:ribosomal protein L20
LVAEGGKKKELTPEERAALDARDLRLLRGLIAKDDAITAEALGKIAECVLALVKRRSSWLLRKKRWNDCIQDVRALCLRWRDEGLLREDEGVWRLGRRLLKQVADKAKTDMRYQKLSRSLNDDQLDDAAIDRLEAAATNAVMAYRRFPNPEQQAAIREQGQWIAGAMERLSDDERATLDAVVAVWNGDAETVGEALGITEGAGRVRLCRAKCTLARLAVAEGNRELAIRLKGKKHVEALEMLFVEEPEADHRLD